MPDSSASGVCCVQAISVHWNKCMISTPGCVLSSVKLSVMAETEEGAIIHSQLAKLEYPDMPDPSEMLPLSAVNKPHVELHPEHW